MAHTTTAPAPFVQLAAVERDLRTGSVIRLARGGPELEITGMSVSMPNVQFELVILDGGFKGSQITRLVHPYEDIQHVR